MDLINCICGHGEEWHRHLDECRFEDDCQCQEYTPVPEGGFDGQGWLSFDQLDQDYHN